LALGHAGDDEEAERWFRRALEFDSHEFAPNANLGVALLRKRKPAEAKKYLEAALVARPKHPQLNERLGMVEEMQGRLDQALGYYELAAKLVPNAPNLRKNIDRVRTAARSSTTPPGPAPGLDSMLRKSK
jgi:Tfp pilus assembly protein PilF